MNVFDPPCAPTFFLFTTDAASARVARDAGVDSVIVDWERLGKAERQNGFETEINTDTPKDVARLNRRSEIPITVRINQLHDDTPNEIDVALDRGADAIMLPMARTPHEVQSFVNLVGNRASTFVQIETNALAQQCAKLRSIDWDVAHVGLNDLLITGDHEWLWEPLRDGTIEHVCEVLSGRRIGFGSVTVVGGGAPIPFIRLMQEMARLGCTVKILRRTFKEEIGSRNVQAEMNAYRATWDALVQRDEAAVAVDHERLQSVLRDCRPVPAA